jgi:gamma-glutamylcyclotransferase (GGCT)/AIG2-like uncharacterized protein YtfP
MKDAYLFVYGTLRRGTDSEMYHLPARHADFVGDATYQGKLYKIDYYPGVVASEDPSDVVHGEVYRLREPDLVLSRLDQYEECGPGFPEPTEYTREIQPVRLRSGETISAWLYLYNRPTDNLELVSSGDFLETVKREAGSRKH